MEKKQELPTLSPIPEDREIVEEIRSEVSRLREGDAGAISVDVPEDPFPDFITQEVTPVSSPAEVRPVADDMPEIPSVIPTEAEQPFVGRDPEIVFHRQSEASVAKVFSEEEDASSGVSPYAKAAPGSSSDSTRKKEPSNAKKKKANPEKPEKEPKLSWWERRRLKKQGKKTENSDESVSVRNFSELQAEQMQNAEKASPTVSEPTSSFAYLYDHHTQEVPLNDIQGKAAETMRQEREARAKQAIIDAITADEKTAKLVDLHPSFAEAMEEKPTLSEEDRSIPIDGFDYQAWRRTTQSLPKLTEEYLKEHPELGQKPEIIEAQPASAASNPLASASKAEPGDKVAQEVDVLMQEAVASQPQSAEAPAETSNSAEPEKPLPSDIPEGKIFSESDRPEQTAPVAQKTEQTPATEPEQAAVPEEAATMTTASDAPEEDTAAPETMENPDSSDALKAAELPVEHKTETTFPTQEKAETVPEEKQPEEPVPHFVPVMDPERYRFHRMPTRTYRLEEAGKMFAEALSQFGQPKADPIPAPKPEEKPIVSPKEEPQPSAEESTAEKPPVESPEELPKPEASPKTYRAVLTLDPSKGLQSAIQTALRNTEKAEESKEEPEPVPTESAAAAESTEPTVTETPSTATVDPAAAEAPDTPVEAEPTAVETDPVPVAEESTQEGAVPLPTAVSPILSVPEEPELPEEILLELEAMAPPPPEPPEEAIAPKEVVPMPGTELVPAAPAESTNPVEDTNPDAAQAQTIPPIQPTIEPPQGKAIPAPVQVEEEFIASSPDTKETEYTPETDPKTISDAIKATIRELHLRTFVTGAATAALLVTSLICEKFLPATANHIPYLVLNLVFLLIPAGLCYKTIVNGIRSLFHLQGNIDSGISIALLASMAQGVALFFQPHLLDTYSVHLYSSIAVGALLLNTLGKLSMMNRISRNFIFATSSDAKYSVEVYEDISTAIQLAKGCITEAPQIAYQHKTKFLRNFLKHSYHSDPSMRTSQLVAPIALAASAMLCVATMLITRNVMIGLTAFSLATCVSAPIAGVLCVNLPVSNLCRLARRHNAMLVSYETVEKMADVNAILLDSVDLFPKDSITLGNFKSYCGGEVNECVFRAAAVMSNAGGTLRDLFEGVINAQKEMLPKANHVHYEEGLGMSGLVNGKTVLVGTYALLAKHQIFVPEVDRSAMLGKNQNLLFLAEDGNLKARLTVTYAADLKMVHEMQRLERCGIVALVRAMDPCLTESFLAAQFHVDAQSLRVLPAELGPVCDDALQTETEEQETLLATRGKTFSMLRMLSACVRQKHNISVAVTLQVVSMILGFVLVAFLSCYAGLQQLTTLSILIYEAVWLVAILLIPKIRKP